MPDKSSREIERELEYKRGELSDTIDEALNRMTLEGAWNYAGRYLRDNRGTYGRTVGSVIKEKPLAVGLVAVGMAWIMFGSSTNDRRHARHETYRGTDREHDARMRERLADADFDDTTARGPTGPEARPDPWAAPSRTPAPSGLGGTSSSASGAPTATAGTSSPSAESSAASNETRSGVAEPKPAAPAVVPSSTPASAGGPTTTPTSREKPAGDPDTSSGVATNPRTPKA